MVCFSSNKAHVGCVEAFCRWQGTCKPSSRQPEWIKVQSNSGYGLGMEQKKTPLFSELAWATAQKCKLFEIAMHTGFSPPRLGRWQAESAKDPQIRYCFEMVQKVSDDISQDVWSRLLLYQVLCMDGNPQNTICFNCFLRSLSCGSRRVDCPPLGRQLIGGWIQTVSAWIKYWKRTCCDLCELWHDSV